MISPSAQLAAVAKLFNVSVAANAAWVYGMDYMIAAQSTRRGFFWEVTDLDAQDEIGGQFPTARAAVDFALARGPIA